MSLVRQMPYVKLLTFWKSCLHKLPDPTVIIHSRSHRNSSQCHHPILHAHYSIHMKKSQVTLALRSAYAESLFRLLSDICKDAAINVKDMSINEVRSIGCKEYSRSLQILWCAPAGCWCLRNDELIKWMP